jgi:L-lactate dehydrogenase complex protein LldG
LKATFVGDFLSANSSNDDLNTDSARAEIFKRIRTLQSRPLEREPGEQAKAREYINSGKRGPLPKAVGDVPALFIQRSKAMLCTVDEVADMNDVAAACARFLEANHLEGRPAIWPSLKELDWTALGRESRFGAPTGDDLIGISAVAYAVAETGTLVFASRADEPASTHLLPETHIAIVRQDQVVHAMEDAFARLRQDGRAMPRALNFVSGPSRTADIEQTIVLGAHGPYRVHLIVVKGKPNE